MPRFFFHFSDGQTWSEDDVGLEFGSAEQAFVGAYAAARDMWKELIGKCDPRSCAFDIRNEDGESLLQFEFSELLGPELDRLTRKIAAGPLTHVIEATHRRASRAREEFNSSLEGVLRSLSESRALVARLEKFDHRAVAEIAPEA